MSDKFIYGLDIGSSKIVAIVANIGEEFSVKGFSSYYYLANEHDNNQLVTDGVISNLSRVSEHALNCLHEAKEMADCSYGSVVLNISGVNVHSVYLTRNYAFNGSVFNYDFVQNVLMNDVANYQTPNGYEILDYEIQEYSVDGFYTKNPLDLSCDEVVANVNLFIGKSINIRNLNRVLEKGNYFNIYKIIPNGILSSMSVLTTEEKLSGVCMLDIGAKTTDIVVYENGYLRELFVLPMGGESIITDIRNSLKVTRTIAEELIINYGKCYFNIGKSSSEKIRTLNHRNQYIEVSVLKLNDIILQRLRVILNILKDQLVKKNLYGIIQSGFVVTGGVALLDGIDKTTSDILGCACRIGSPMYSGEGSDILCSPRYATIMGMVKFANEVVDDYEIESHQENLIDRFKMLFKRFE